jgi:hypothetical protein
MDERNNMVLRKARAWYGRPDFASGIRPLIGTAFDYVNGWSEREAEGPGASTLGSGAGREAREGRGSNPLIYLRQQPLADVRPEGP